MHVYRLALADFPFPSDTLDKYGSRYKKISAKTFCPPWQPWVHQKLYCQKRAYGVQTATGNFKPFLSTLSFSVENFEFIWCTLRKFFTLPKEKYYLQSETMCKPDNFHQHISEYIAPATPNSFAIEFILTRTLPKAS